MDEKNVLLNKMIKPVKVNMIRSGSLFGLFDGAASPDNRRAYEVANPANIIIPAEASSKIEKELRTVGIAPTQEKVLRIYLSSKEVQ
jgi:hypothetical protein